MDEFRFQDWRLNVFWGAMVAAGLVAGFVFGWMWRDRPAALADIRVLDVLTVIGTVGATVVALWLGLAGLRRQREMMLQAGIVARWMLRTEITEFYDELGRVDSQIRSVMRLKDKVKMEQAVTALQQKSVALALPTVQLLVDKLVYLPFGEGEIIGSVYGHLPKIKALIAEIDSAKGHEIGLFMAGVHALSHVVKIREVVRPVVEHWEKYIDRPFKA